MASSRIDVETCGKLVDTAYQSCAMAPQHLPAGPEPQHFDALANSFAALSAAFTWGTVVLGFLAIFLAIGWGVLVRVWAEREAKREAAECVKKHVDEWRAKDAPQLVRFYVELLAKTGSVPRKPNDEDEAADKMGEGAG